MAALTQAARSHRDEFVRYRALVLLTSFSERAAGDLARELLRAKDLVDRSYAEPLDVTALARHAHVSPAHFSRRFKEAFGETPYQYVLTRRVERAQEELGLTQRKTKEIVQKTFDAIVETLLREKRIELRNFGVFEVKRRKARKARNPRTGEKVDVEPKNVVTFKPGKEMEERVRQLEQAEAEGRPLPPRVRSETTEDLFEDEPRPTSASSADEDRSSDRGSSLDDEPSARESGQNWHSSTYAP